VLVDHPRGMTCQRSRSGDRFGRGRSSAGIALASRERANPTWVVCGASSTRDGSSS